MGVAKAGGTMAYLRCALVAVAAALVVLVLPAAPAQGAPTCGDGSLDGSFASSTVNGAIATEGEQDCYGLEGVSVGDRVSVGLLTGSVSGSTPEWAVLDGHENQICRSSSQSGTCQISGSGEWSLVIRSYQDDGTFSYALAARRLDDPQGCSPLGEPSSWSFDSARTDGSLAEPLAARCYTFSRTLGEADGNYWFRAVRTGGSLSPTWRVYDPSGGEECSGSSSNLENHCSLLGYGQFALVVGESGGGFGSFYVTARRLDLSDGCDTAISTTIGAVTSGSISNSSETDCYSLPDVSASDSVTIGLTTTSGSNQSPRWTLIDGAGNPVCYYYGYGSMSRPCSLTGAPDWRLVVYDASGAGTFSYSVAVRGVTDPQGCTSLGAPEVWSFASGRLNGSIDTTLDADCYTFERGAGDPDGSYWFKTSRTAGNLSPYWTVYGPSGEKECEGSEGSPESPCRLRAGGKYVFVVGDGAGERTGSYFATAHRLSSPEGCGSLASLSFAADPVSGQLANGGAADCYGIPGASEGDSLSVGLYTSASASPRWVLVDSEGDTICNSSSSYRYSCTLNGQGPWSLIVYDSGSASFAYSLAARRLDDPEGCSPLDDPAAWSFTSPRLSGTIASKLQAHCYTFSRSLGEPDASYWFRTLRQSGTLSPEWSLYGPGGSRECGRSSEGPEYECRLTAEGQYTFVVSDSGSQTGTYIATARKLTSPTGCAQTQSIASGTPSLLGNLANAGEVDCYALPVSEGDELEIEVSGAANRFAVVGPDGRTRCTGSSRSTCSFQADGPDYMLLYSTNTDSGNYHYQLTCNDPPCGQTETALATAEPSHLGKARFATVLLRGHDLDLLDGVTLSRSGQQIAGEIEEPSKDARAVDVRFDLSDAAVGGWTLSGHFSDGSTRTIAAAVTVEAAHESPLSVETISRSAIRIGTQTPLSVVVHNPGNVDAVAVPVVLRGLPAGATLTPVFDTYTPVGNPGEVSMSKLGYDQASETVTEDGEVIAPFMVARVPAGRSVSMDFMITVPAVSSYTLHAFVGKCLATTEPTPGWSAAPGASHGGQAAAATEAVGPDEVNCAGAIAGAATSATLDLLGANPCVGLASGLIVDAAVDARGGEGFWSWSHALTWAAEGALCAGEIAFPGAAVAATTLGMAMRATDFSLKANDASHLIGDCMFMGQQSSLDQRSLVSIDPNDLEGPAGVGAQRYIQADSPLTYRVLFENLGSAGAAANSIEIRDALDPSVFDPGSVLIAGIRFGNTQYTLPYPSPTLDETFDLRPGTNAQVHVTAAVSGNELRADLVAIDPDTLEPPTDPSVGVLPPNVDPPEGEGELLYTVEPQQLPSGAQIQNTASIQFDQNEPIVTPTWTNTIDRSAPTATVSAAGTSQPLDAEVSWGGEDDAAGISLWRVEVSEDGGPFELWRTATEPGSATYQAPVAGSYSFRVVTYDGAGNEGHSSLSGVTLEATRSLTVTRSGSGSGVVRSTPAGIDCGATCAGEFAHGSTVTLTAAPNPGSRFLGWSGGGCSGTGACQVALDSDTTVGATFAPVPTAATPAGGSSQVSSPPSARPPAKPTRCRRGFKKKVVHGKAKCVKTKKKKRRKKGRKRKGKKR